MPDCVFVTDLHGSSERYDKLFDLIESDLPKAVFIGGDLLPHALHRKLDLKDESHDFLKDYLIPEFTRLMNSMRETYPRVFIILGNDDPRIEEGPIEEAAVSGIWEYMHGRESRLAEYSVFGYACVPPTPFQLKDWDKYDVSRFVDPGCISPEEGRRSVPVPLNEIRHSSIKKDLLKLEDGKRFERTIFMFHTPPYKTNLDRAALDGKMIDHAPVDVHVGSIAVMEFIERVQPLITLHGHIHESARITGEWRDKIGRTFAFSAAHDGSQLAVVRFDPARPESARRDLI